jgi:hypothetical protein
MADNCARCFLPLIRSMRDHEIFKLLQIHNGEWLHLHLDRLRMCSRAIMLGIIR